jgi:hypothetical protein
VPRIETESNLRQILRKLKARAGNVYFWENTPLWDVDGEKRTLQGWCDRAGNPHPDFSCIEFEFEGDKPTRREKMIQVEAAWGPTLYNQICEQEEVHFIGYGDTPKRTDTLKIDRLHSNIEGNGVHAEFFLHVLEGSTYPEILKGTRMEWTTQQYTDTCKDLEDEAGTAISEMETKGWGLGGDDDPWKSLKTMRERLEMADFLMDFRPEGTPIHQSTYGSWQLGQETAIWELEDNIIGILNTIDENRSSIISMVIELETLINETKDTGVEQRILGPIEANINNAKTYWSRMDLTNAQKMLDMASDKMNQIPEIMPIAACLCLTPYIIHLRSRHPAEVG